MEITVWSSLSTPHQGCSVENLPVNFLISRHEDDLMSSFFLSDSYTMASLWIKLDLHNLVTPVYTDIVKATVGNLRKKLNEIASSGRFNFESFPFIARQERVKSKKKEERKKDRKKEKIRASLSRFFCYSTMKWANNTMLEVDDVSSGCPVTNRPVIRLARAGTNVSRVDFFLLFIFMPRIKFVVIKITLFHLNNTLSSYALRWIFFFTSFLCITSSRAPDFVVFVVRAGRGFEAQALE